MSVYKWGIALIWSNFPFKGKPEGLVYVPEWLQHRGRKDSAPRREAAECSWRSGWRHTNQESCTKSEVEDFLINYGSLNPISRLSEQLESPLQSGYNARLHEKDKIHLLNTRQNPRCSWPSKWFLWVKSLRWRLMFFPLFLINLKVWP